MESVTLGMRQPAIAVKLVNCIYKSPTSRYCGGFSFIFMYTFRFLFPALVALLLSVAPARAQSVEDPSDQYFRGYIMNNDAERAAQAGSSQSALEKYQQAQAIFDQIAKTAPSWQPQMLKFRRDRIADAMAALQAKIAATPPPAPAPSPAPTAVTPAAVATIPSGGLPQAPLPAAAANPVAVPAPGSMSVDDALNAIKKAMEAQAAQKNQQVLEAQAELGRYTIAYDTVLKQRDEIAKTYQTLAQAATAQQTRLADLEKQSAGSAGAKAELDKLRAEQAETAAQLTESRQRLAESQKSVMKQSKDLMETGMKLSALQKEHTQLTEKLAAATKDRDAIALERDKAVKERDTLTAQIAAGKTSGSIPANLKDLAVENQRLKKDLDAARKQVESLKTDATSKDKEIAQLKGQLTQIQGELVTLKRENAAYESQVSELTLNLKEVRKRMDNPKKGKPAESTQLMAENQLLRGVILRQLRQQARQQQQKTAVIAEIQKTENASKELIDQVEQLGGIRFNLSADEQKLFTTPQLQEIMGEGGIQATIIAKSTAQTPANADARKTDQAATSGAAAVDGLLAKGNQALQDGKFAEAAAAYDDVLRADPKNASGFAGLAWARVQQNKLDDAEVTLKKSLAYDANNATAHYMLGVTQFRRDRLNEAMTSFEKSLNINGKNARARHYLGVICSKMGLAPRAEREFKAALAIDPEYGEACFNLAVLYITWDPPRWEEARKNYTEAVKKGVTADPNLEKILNAGGPAVSKR